MSDWKADALLPGFEALTLEFPDDYDGRAVATLVRLPTGNAPRGPVLYLHGFVDYFFQRHMAERFAAEGYAFHALDLRKHGRSWLGHQHPCFCKDMTEYHADITAALETIGAPVLLAGHSTGGLVCALYAHRGERRDALRALWLNSPFFDWKASPFKRAQLGMAAIAGRAFP
ncbi:MAG: lysophospholipase, partial [Betaproteobacteria bacterium]|nr:lysophospholipase [Betaproteobacteria bacterium]